MRHVFRLFFLGLASLALVACAALPTGKDARQIHDDLLTLDTHFDTPALLMRGDFDITDRHDPLMDYSQVDVPRMREGGLDGGFWVIFTAQGDLSQASYQAARDQAVLRAAAIHKMVAKHDDIFELATTAQDAARIEAQGKISVYMSIENAYPLGEDLSLLSTFYDLGVRMVGPVHSANNQFADSSTDKDGLKWNGLSPLGRELVKAANRLGMIVDGSHAHDLAFDDMLELSATPIILSHSGAKDVYDHPRNIDDVRLKKLAAKGGVIQMNALGAYLTKVSWSPERVKAFGAFMKEYRAADLSAPGESKRLRDMRRALDAEFPADMADFEDYMRHFLHALKLIGPKHVGIGADWDGGGGVTGMLDVAAVDKITQRLIAEGYSQAELQDIWSGNVLRLLKAAQDHARLHETQ